MLIKLYKRHCFWRDVSCSTHEWWTENCKHKIKPLRHLNTNFDLTRWAAGEWHHSHFNRATRCFSYICVKATQLQSVTPTFVTFSPWLFLCFFLFKAVENHTLHQIQLETINFKQNGPTRMLFVMLQGCWLCAAGASRIYRSSIV